MKQPVAVTTVHFVVGVLTTLVGPIIPPFAIAYSTSYASSNTSNDMNKSKSEAALAPPFNISPSLK